MMIPDESVREVRERAPILEVVSQYITLKKSGANHQGCCPFHGEKSPSFNVNPARGIFHCFGCGAGGNVVTFVMKMEGLNFPQAIKHLAKQVGVEIPERELSTQEKRKLDEKEQFYLITEIAAAFYRRTLESAEEGASGRSYLAQRGVDDQTAATYRLGFAPAGWDSLAKHLQKKGVELAKAEKLGLLRKKERKGGYYDTFRNRLLFTISDQQSRPIGFGGRVMDDSLPKYINSPESSIYRKSEVLFGLDLAKKGIQEKNGAILVEGYFDHMALYRAGYTNVVATCGTALTPQHLRLLKRYCERAYMLFDGDSAGQKATVRSMELFLEEGFPARVVEVPSGDDPDTFIRREGGAAFAHLLEKALPIFESFYRGLMKTLNIRTVDGKVALINEVTPRLSKIKDPVERELYEKEICKAVGLELGMLRDKVGTVSPEVAQPGLSLAPRRARTEDILLRLLAKSSDLVTMVREYGAEKLFQGTHLVIAQAILVQDAEGGVDISQILEQLESPEEDFYSLFVEESIEEIDAKKVFGECLQAIKRSALMGKAGSLARELAMADAESPRFQEVLGQLKTAMG